MKKGGVRGVFPIPATLHECGILYHFTHPWEFGHPAVPGACDILSHHYMLRMPMEFGYYMARAPATFCRTTTCCVVLLQHYYIPGRTCDLSTGYPQLIAIHY